MYKRVYPGPYRPYRPAKRFRSWQPKNAKSQYVVQNRVYPRGPLKSGSLMQQVKSLQKFVDKMKPEKKYFESDLTLTNIVDAAGGIVEITAMAAGDTGTTRTGNAINVTDVRCAVTFPRGDATVDPTGSSTVRWAIVVDTQQVEDTDPAVVDIFSGADPVAFPELTNLSRFRILYCSPQYDALMMHLNAPTVNTIPTIPNSFDYTWSGNLRVQYNGSATSDIQKNGIYFVVLCDGFGSTLDCVGTARIGFTDA